MESPNSGRGRGRFSSRKRSTIPARSSSQRRSEPSEMPSSSTPAAPVAPASTSFTFETPSPSTARGTRTRMRNLDGVIPSPEEATSKGGRSLRKRTRIDYSFDQPDEDEQSNEAKATPTATRSLKKRKTDPLFVDEDFEEDLESTTKRRQSEQPSKPVARRNVGRKSTVEPQPLVAEQPDEEVTVQDTIEVGGHRSQQASEASSHRRSSNSSQKDPVVSGPALTQSSTKATFPLPLPAFGTLEFTEEPETDIKSEPTQELQIPKIEVEEAVSMVVQQPGVNGHGRLPSSSPAPVQAPPSPLPVLDEGPDDPFARLTPYINGATTLYPTLRATTSAPSADQDGVTEETPVDEVVEDNNEAPDDSTPAGSPVAIEDTAANSPAPDVGTPDVPAVIPKKQYSYKKLRPAQDFIDFISDYESLSYPELWARLDHLTSVLETIQHEHNGCRKIIDDEENSVKYHQEEALFQHRVKLARSKDPNADPVRKDFVVKGIRAPKSDAMIEHAKQQDRVMANAYGFEYDDRDSKVSQQDPIGQRGGVGKGRLRDRPKQTAKAAEADDGPVLHGKRPRKAPNLFGDFESASRGSTPVPTVPRKRRGRQPAEDSEGSSFPAPVAEPVVEETPKKRGKGGRPRKHPLPTAIPESVPAPDLEAEPDAHEEGRPARKRRRRHFEEDDLPVNGTNGQALPGVGTRRRNSRLGDIPSGSFYSNASTQPNDESRPNTSSSTGTVSTTTSTYGLREKRQKRFSLDDDDEDFEDEEQPKPKRIRRVPKKVQEQDFANIPASNIPETEPNAAAVPKAPRIRIKGAAPSMPGSGPTTAPTSDPISVPQSGISTPGQVMNGDAMMGVLEDNKDYGQMTKSEKMSASMKARWASGSMSNAVAKRRATLAAKKAATQTPVPEGTPDTGIDQLEQQQLL
ncbi:hypothetical protein SCARD494_00337 [Seiridium cardinale]